MRNTITDKGQTMLPVAMRRKLGLDSSGGILQISFNETSHEVVILTIDELSKRVSRHIKPGTKPVYNVDEYYQRYRSFLT